MKFVPKAAAKTATWTVTVGMTGSYKLYAKWPASSAHATDAQFTITHASGTSTVTANQRLNGGQWNLLGTYTFNSGTSYKVDLSDQVTAGKVAADAIYIAGTGAPTDTFTWTPAFPSAGTYQVYARWPASSGNTGAAQYTVTRDGGTSTVTLNQKQNGSTWVLLGSYNFTPSAGQKVTLAASANGTTIADALLFVGAGAQPANLLYVHDDHLGSPQKLTDASQATVWDGVFDPFGEEVALTGLAATPRRFPGQYADDETRFSYNFLRDYDPTLGRYIESDPIGLNGGLNTYTYVRNNPTARIDPSGRQEAAMVTCFSGPNPICIGATAVTACKWAVIGAITLGGIILLDEAIDDTGTPTTESEEGNGPPPNNGDAAKHGGEEHNGAIDDHIEDLKKDPSVENIRKNQTQVDVNGDSVGNNRPDVQYDKDGCHHCTEFDHDATRSQNHGDIIRGNDPNAKVDLKTAPLIIVAIARKMDCGCKED